MIQKPQRNPIENLTGWIAFEKYAEGDEAEWGWYDPLPDVKSLVEQLEGVTKQRDAIMEMLEAERPPEEVFAFFRNLEAGSQERDLSSEPISSPVSVPAKRST